MTPAGGTRAASAGRAAWAAVRDRRQVWGLAGLALYALASVWQTAPANLGLAIALLAVACGLRRGLRSDAVGAATLALAVWLCVRYALQCAGVGEPGLIKPQAGFVDWLAPLTFALLATLVPATARLAWLRRLWLLAMAGCALGVLGFLIARGPGVLWSGERLGYHLNRPLGIGLYAGVFVVVLVASARCWWACAGRWRWPVRIAGLAAIVLFLQVLVGAQNRATWLALLLVAAGALVAGLYGRWRSGRAPAWRRLGLGLVMVAAALAAAVATNRGAFERLGSEREVIAAIGDGGLDTAPATSISARLRLWQFTLRRWPDAPLLGHGFGGLQDVVDAQERARVALPAGERYDHVHNSYLQTLWTQGVIGVVLWTLLVALLLRDGIRAARVNAQVRALLPVVWGALGFVAVWACFDYRISHPDMRCFAILLLLSLRLLGQAGSDDAQAPSTSA